MSDVFISYSRKDKEFVRRLNEALRKHGRDTWVDWQDIAPTEKWLDAVYAGIEAADTFLFVLSPQALASKICRQEIEHAAGHNKRLVPVVYQEVDAKDVPPALSSHNWIFFRDSDDFDAAIATLIKAFDTDLEWVRDHTRWLTRAIEWDGEGRADSLLLRENVLEEAEGWLTGASAHKQPQPTPLQTEFIVTSRQEETKRGKEENRRRRAALAAVTAGLIVAVAAAAFAFDQARRAETAARHERAAKISARTAQGRAEAAAESEKTAKKKLQSALTEQEKATRQAIEAAKAERAAKQIANEKRAEADAQRNEAERQKGFAAGNAQAARKQSLLAEVRRRDAERQRGIAQQQTRLARRQANVALARQLATQAQVLQDKRADLLPVSVLLAVESLKRMPSSQADQVLRRGLVLLPPSPPRPLTYGDAVTALAYSPDGAYLATATADGKVWLSEAGKRRPASPLLRHPDRVIGMAFNRESRLLTTVSARSLRVFDVASRREVDAQRTEPRVYSVAFSPDGERVALASSARDMRVWDVPGKRQVAQMKYPDSEAELSGEVESLAFSPDGKQLATAFREAVSVWDAADGGLVTRLPHEGLGLVLNVAFSPDGKYLATKALSRTRLWDRTNWQEVGSFNDTVTALAFSPDGSYLATADGNSVGVAEIETLRSLRASGSFGPAGAGTASGWRPLQLRGTFFERIHSLVFSPDGSYLAAAGENKTVRVWRIKDGEEAARVLHGARVNALAFSPRGALLATGGADKTVRVRRIAPFPVACTTRVTGAKQDELVTEAGIARLVFSPNKTFMVMARDDAAQVFRTADGQRIARLSHPLSLPREAIRKREIALLKRQGAYREGAHVDVLGDREALWGRAFFSANERYLVTARIDGSVRIWDVAGGRETARVPCEDFLGNLALSPSSRCLATNVDPDKTVRLWKIPGGREVARFVHDRPVNALVFSPDDRCLATTDARHDLRVFVIGSGRLLSHTQDQARLRRYAPQKDLLFSPDGRYLAAIRYWLDKGTSSLKEATRVLELTRGQTVVRIEETRTLGAFSPDSRYFAVCALNRVRLLDLKPRRFVALDHATPVDSVRFSPRGTYLAAFNQRAYDAQGATIARRTAGVWRLRDRHKIAPIANYGGIANVVFSPDDSTLTLTGEEETVRVCRVAGGQSIAQFPSDVSEIASDVNGIVYSREGRYIAGIDGGTVHVLDARSGEEVARLEHESPVREFQFLPEGNRLVTATWDSEGKLQNTYVWSLDPRSLIAVARARLSRNLTQDEWRQFFGDEPYRRTFSDLPAGK